MSSNKESNAGLRWFFGLVYTYPDIFENGQFSPPFSKKIRVHTSRILIALACPHEKAETVWMDTIACLTGHALFDCVV